jgi:hypothetical protein
MGLLTQSPSRGRTWIGPRLLVGLFLACLAFWNGAELFHDDDSSEYQADCPVCNLAKVSSCETPAVSVALADASLSPVGRAVFPRRRPGISAVHRRPAGPRGPPPLG